MNCLLFLLVFVFSLFAGEEKKYWVFFTDKGEFENWDARKLKEKYPDRCVSRRAKVGASFSWQDLPVSKLYCEQLENHGVKIHTSSKWLNAASVYADSCSILKLKGLPFVRDVKRVIGFKRNEPEIETRNVSALRDPVYGVSFDQLVRVGIPYLHRLGLTGHGVMIGVFDTGYNLRHRAFSEIDIFAQYDFVYNDSNVENEAGVDPFGQDNHGTAVLSILGGYDIGNYIGGAYNATFVLAKTEDISSETPIEEDNWIRASEWAESLGVDIITSSLGYWDWYSPSDMDGRTAPISICATRLARLGVLVCNAVGNSGPAPMTVVAPADADSIISVGAIDSRDSVAVFSSRGPTADLRIKPDLVCPGVYISVASAYETTEYFAGSGTSFATPILAALAALVLQAHPYKTPAELIDMLKRSASKSDCPNNDYGWGKPNGHLALAFTDSSTFLYVLFSGWNLISFPVRVREGFRFCGQVGSFYSYDGSRYVAVDSPLIGRGYFVFVERDTLCQITGAPSSFEPIDLTPGWNLIGGGRTRFISRLTDLFNPASSVLPSATYEYDPVMRKYRKANGLAPTKGYWIFLLENATYFPRF